MKCVFEDSGSKDERGARPVQCVRCRKQLKPTASPLHKIHRLCDAWPFLWEIGYWLTLFLEVAGLSNRRWNWLRRRFGFVEPCNCESRAEWLNSVPGRIMTLWRRLTSREL